ncbi:unnamed protein product, partial [Pleuronectes platessa]
RVSRLGGNLPLCPSSDRRPEDVSHHLSAAALLASGADEEQPGFQPLDLCSALKETRECLFCFSGAAGRSGSRPPTACSRRSECKAESTGIEHRLVAPSVDSVNTETSPPNRPPGVLCKSEPDILLYLLHPAVLCILGCAAALWDLWKQLYLGRSEEKFLVLWSKGGVVVVVVVCGGGRRLFYLVEELCFFQPDQELTDVVLLAPRS